MDSSNPKTRSHDHSLAYRLRPSVSWQRMTDGKAALVLHYPLRAIFIHATWHGVVDCLAHGDPMPLERLAAAAPDLPSEQIELFLNTLIRKGYVDQEGFVRLDEADYPDVTVIVPVRNRPEEIRACLASLQNLDYPAHKLEIIVVDDASDDDTPQVVRQFSDARLIVMEQHRQASYCRNHAARAARGEVLAFIDSDCLADSTWLKELVPAFRDPSLGALGGWVDAASVRNGLDRYEKVKSALKMGSWFKRTEQAERFFYVPACNFLVRKEAFLGLGGFRESLHVGEDVDLCWRLQDAGHSLEYRPMGRVLHRHRNRIGAFCKRRFEYGTSEPTLQRLHTGRVKTLYLPWTESLFWMSILFSWVLGTAVPLFFGAGLLLVHGARKYRLLKSRGVIIAPYRVYLSIVRGYLAFVYHCCSFISRYYLIVLPVILPVAPLAAAVMAGMHLSAGMVEYAVRKPPLNPVVFLVFFTLEQASYQSGVWYECIRSTNYRPVLPRIIHTRT